MRAAASGVVGAALALLAQLALVPAAAGTTGIAAASGATAFPGGRKTFVVSVMDGKPQALSVRLATYEFKADGTVTERYWAWQQNAISGKGNARWTKPASGYRTTGCQYTCPIRTPAGFQKGRSPHVFTGRWSMEQGSVLAIRWTPAYPVERWKVDTSRDEIAGLRLLSARDGGHGWGAGSNAPANRGVSLAQVYKSDWITGPFVSNVYSPKSSVAWVGLSARDYRLCNTGTCLQGTKMGGSNRSTWYHSYLAANPAVDGRKVYWNNQTGVVQQLENPNTTCISASGGGHTNALLQVLDDNGRFAGFVGVEASLNQRVYGQAVVAAFAMVTPSLLPAIES
ncbi:MAG: hypothetical protein QG622_1256 [Actinomycetota bacterium]|nr:hypothetical protein [Actinomycetota bacterium]